MNKIVEIINNKEFQSRVVQSLDISHLTQMIERQVFDHHEILIVLDTVIGFIFEIQSDIRKNEYQRWYEEKTMKFRHQQPQSQINKSASEESKSIIFNELIFFLPLFFEMALLRIDELQLEVIIFFSYSFLKSYSYFFLIDDKFLSWFNWIICN